MDDLLVRVEQLEADLDALLAATPIQPSLVTMDDVVGIWSCECHFLSTLGATTGWTESPDGNSNSLSQTITFTDDGDGTYSVTTTAPNPFNPGDGNVVSSDALLLGGVFFFPDIGGPPQSGWDLIYYRPGRLDITRSFANSIRCQLL